MNEKKPITERIIHHLGKAAMSLILLPISAIITALVVTAAIYLMPTVFTEYIHISILFFIVPWMMIYAIILHIFDLTNFAKGLSTFELMNVLSFALFVTVILFEIAMYTVPVLSEKNDNIKVIVFLIAFALITRIFVHRYQKKTIK